MWKILLGVGAVLFGLGALAGSVYPNPTNFGIEIDDDTIDKISSFIDDYRYNYAIVTVTAPATQIVFEIADDDDDGWGYDNESDTKTVNLTLEETTGRDVVVTSVHWMLYDSGNHNVVYGTEVVHKSIAGNGIGTVSVDVTIDEDDAYQLDYEDKPSGDYKGKGRIVFEVYGQDTKIAENIRSIEGSVDVRVTTP